MITLPAAPGAVKVRLHFSIGDNHNCSSHLFLKTPGIGPGSAELATIAGYVDTQWNTNLRTWHHSQVVLDRVEAENLGDPSIIPGVVVGNRVGGRAGDVPGADQCVLVNLAIARRYRGGKPRLYLPLLNGGDLADPRHWNATILGGLSSAFTAFVNGVKTAVAGDIPGADLCSVSYYSGKSLRSVPVIDPVAGWTLNPIPGVQRRRFAR